MKMKTYSDRMAKAAAILAAVLCPIVTAQEQHVQTPAEPVAADPAWADFEDAAGVTTDAAAANFAAAVKGVSGRGTELSAQALASAPYLFFDRDARGYLRPGSSKLEKSKEKAAYQQFDKVIVKPSGKTEYKVGDTVDVLNGGKVVRFNGQTAQLLTRRGRAVVDELLGGNKIVIRLIELWGVVRGGESIVPAAAFQPIYYEDLAKPEREIDAAVIMRIEETVIPYLHQHFIVDKGTDAGVMLGDFFTVKESVPNDQLSEETLLAQVVSVTPVSATLVIMKLFKNSLKTGDRAYISRRPIQAKAAPASVPAQAQ